MKISLVALFVFLGVQTQAESFEKRAMSAAQQVSASSLDVKLPKLSFVAWLNGIVGQKAGVVWQLAECGIGPSGGTDQDLPACAEANVLLPNGDTVIVGISVGTFKKGLIGEPTFQGAVLKSGERLYQIRRLSDLPGMLRLPKGIPSVLPDIQAGLLQVDVDLSTTYPPLALLNPGNNASAPGFSVEEETPPPPPPQSRQSPVEMVEANPITKAKPVYPAAARTMGVSGKVEVRVVISETGRVTEATAISGHMTLRNAAEDAARKWVYKPATRNGVPVRMESVLTFTFAPSDQ